MKPLTVVVVNDFAHVNGGAGQVALSSAAALAERGYGVHLLSAVGPVADGIKSSAVRVHLLDQHEIAKDPRRLRAIVQGVWNRKAHRAMKRLLAELDRENTVVHFHVWIKSLSSSVVRAVIDSGFRAVVTMHDFFLTCPNGGLFNYQTNRICELVPMSPACLITNCDKRSYAQKIWRSLRQTVQLHSGRMPYGLQDFISISDLSEELLRPYLPKSAVIHRVPNPVVVPKAAPSNPADNSHFMFVGRLDPEKGPLLAAEAAAAVGAEVTFVGDGACREQVTRLLPQAVVTGWVSPVDVAARMRAARALVFPSLWYETLGLTVLEAAAVGLPAIVPDTSAAREMVQDGVTGLVFEGGDASDLADKMKKLRDSALVEQMGRAAYERYWATPSTVERHVERLEEVYREMLAR